MEDYVIIAALDTVTEARLVEAALIERNIPHALHSHEVEALDGSWGHVDAPKDYQKVIMFVISDLRKDASRHQG